MGIDLKLIWGNTLGFCRSLKENIGNFVSLSGHLEERELCSTTMSGPPPQETTEFRDSSSGKA